MTPWITNPTPSKLKVSEMAQIKLMVAFVREWVLDIVQRVKTALKRV